MLGLDTFQLVLVLVGAGFIAAGLFGLVPMLSGSHMTPAIAGKSFFTASPKSQKSKQPKAARVVEPPAAVPGPESVAPAVAEPEVLPVPVQAEVSVAEPPEVTAAAEPTATAVETAAPTEEAPIESEVETAEPEAISATAAPFQAIVEEAAREVQAQKQAETAPAVSAVDQDLVDELFAELFALRSSVSTLTSEVRGMRDEQRSRRLVLREVVMQPERKTDKASA